MAFDQDLFLTPRAGDEAGRAQGARPLVTYPEPNDASEFREGEKARALSVSYAAEIEKWEHTLLTPAQRLAIDGPEDYRETSKAAATMTADEGHNQWQRWLELTRAKSPAAVNTHASTGFAPAAQGSAPAVLVDLGIDDTSRNIDERISDVWGER